MTQEKRKAIFTELLATVKRAHDIVKDFNGGATEKDEQGYYLSNECVLRITMDNQKAEIQLSRGFPNKTITVCDLAKKETGDDGWVKLFDEIKGVEVYVYEKEGKTL